MRARGVRCLNDLLHYGAAADTRLTMGEVDGDVVHVAEVDDDGGGSQGGERGRETVGAGAGEELDGVGERPFHL